MRCTSCGTDLIPGKRFCHACGARATAQCPACGANVSAEFRFCPDCGVELASGAVHDVPPPTDDRLARMADAIPEGLAHKIRAAQETIAGERKQVTVLFCDLAGSTAIAERLDPEEYAELLDEYLELSFREIYRLEGIVTYSAGDGLMALFGAPVAHEDAPQRAIRAALAIRSALATLDARLRARNIELRARIGIHTGPVVVGTVGNDLKMDYTAIGDTTNLASRLETAATPGTILVSDATQRLVRGFFRVRAVGPFEVKGKSEPVAAYEILDEVVATTPMAIAAERGLTPLVGRDDELAQLETCFRRLDGGLAQVVALVGDAGLGKSRLAYEFRRRVEGEAEFFEGRCSALGQTVPYYPFLTMLKQYFGLLPGDGKHEVASKVATKLGQESAEKARHEYPALSRLLGMGLDHVGEAGPEELKREMFNAVTHLILDETECTPTVMLLEDLHWLDDASRELLESVVARVANARVMVLVTHRPEDRASWRTRAALTQIVLRRLSDDDVRAIVRAIAGGPLPDALERLLVAKAEGSPFCAEEITRSLLEEGYLAPNGGQIRKLTRPLEEIRIPGTVQEVIAARLDRLAPSAKRVVQVAAVLGRQFRRDQLAALLDGEGIDIDRELAELEQRGLFHRKSLLASDEYRFGESLTQEVAYEGLLLKQRRQLHERIGDLLAREPGEITAELAALLAHHFARGDDRGKAIEALLRAADLTERLPSYATAVDYYRRAAELADADPAEERFRRAALTATSGVARLGVLFGYPSLAEAERAVRRGRELADALGDSEAQVALLYFLGVTTMLSGEFNDGVALSEQAVALAQRAGLDVMVLRLSRGLALNHAFDGRFELARREMDWVFGQLGGPEHAGALSDLYVSAHWMRDNIAFLADDLDAALAGAHRSHEMALSVPNRTVTFGAASTIAQVHFLRGEYEEALRWADDSLVGAEAIGNVAGFPAPAAIALASRVALGRSPEAARYLDFLDRALAAGGTTVQTNLRFLADGLLAVRDLERAERFVEVQQRNPIRSGRLRDAYTATTLGELLMHLGRLEEADAAFTWAIALSDLIGARSTLAGASLGAGEVAAARGDHAGAVRHLERALAIARSMRLGRYVPRIARLLEAPAASSQRA